LKHAYRLVNNTAHDIKVVELVNLKPCCGDLRIGKTMLHAGDETELEVTLSIRQEFGEIVHRTRVVTDPPQQDDLVLLTVAKAYPSIRIEEVTPVNGAVLLSSEKAKSVEFRAFAAGDSSKAAIDLNRVELRSAINAKWLGPKQGVTAEDDLTVEMRRFTALLDPAGAPGERKNEIVLNDDNRPCCAHVVNWEVVSPITASPKMIVMKPGEREYRILVRSGDQTAFRITRIECKVPGVLGRATNSAASLAQTVEVKSEGVSRLQSGRGLITVFTDHPGQEKVDLPFVVID